MRNDLIKGVRAYLNSRPQSIIGLFFFYFDNCLHNNSSNSSDDGIPLQKRQNELIWFELRDNPTLIKGTTSQNEKCGVQKQYPQGDMFSQASRSYIYRLFSRSLSLYIYIFASQRSEPL